MGRRSLKRTVQYCEHWISISRLYVQRTGAIPMILINDLDCLPPKMRLYIFRRILHYPALKKAFLLLTVDPGECDEGAPGAPMDPASFPGYLSPKKVIRVPEDKMFH